MDGHTHKPCKYWHLSARFVTCTRWIAVEIFAPANSLQQCGDAFRCISWVCLVGSVNCYNKSVCSISRHGMWLRSDRLVAREFTWIHCVFQRGHRGQYCDQFCTETDWQIYIRVELALKVPQCGPIPHLEITLSVWRTTNIYRLGSIMAIT